MDFKGKWNIPDNKEATEVIGQCKNEKMKTSVRVVREFEGTILQQTQLRQRSSQNKPLSQLVGILVSFMGFSDFAKRAFEKSEFPMVLITIRENVLQSILMNRKLQHIYPNLQLGFTLASNGHRKPFIMNKSNTKLENP